MMVVVNFMPILIPVLQQLAIGRRMKSVPVLKIIVVQAISFFGYGETEDLDAINAKLEALDRKFRNIVLREVDKPDEETPSDVHLDANKKGSGGLTKKNRVTPTLAGATLPPHIARDESFNT